MEVKRGGRKHTDVNKAAEPAEGTNKNFSRSLTLTHTLTHMANNNINVQ